MTDNVVEGDTGRVAIPAIANRRRLRAVIINELTDQIINMLSRDAGSDLTDQHIKAFRNQPSGLAHSGKAFRVMNPDISGSHWQN